MSQPLKVLPDPEPVLTGAENCELELLESMITHGLSVFLQVGIALASIRDKKLYRAGYCSFEQYCRERWGMSARQAQRNMAGVEIAKVIMEPGVAPYVPINESQLRPLTGLPPEEQRAVWQEAVKTAPRGYVTAKLVAEIVKRRANLVVSNDTKPPIDVRPAGTREALLRATNAVAMAKVRELLSQIGTADSAVSADVNGALERLQRLDQHLERVEELQEARS